MRHTHTDPWAPVWRVFWSCSALSVLRLKLVWVLGWERTSEVWNMLLRKRHLCTNTFSKGFQRHHSDVFKCHWERVHGHRNMFQTWADLQRIKGVCWWSVSTHQDGFGLMLWNVCVCVCVCVCLWELFLGQGSPWFSLLSFALGVGCLEDAGGRHEVLDVLTQNLVLWLQLQVLLFDGVHSSGQVWTHKHRQRQHYWKFMEARSGFSLITAKKTQTQNKQRGSRWIGDVTGEGSVCVGRVRSVCHAVVFTAAVWSELHEN